MVQVKLNQTGGVIKTVSDDRFDELCEEVLNVCNKIAKERGNEFESCTYSYDPDNKAIIGVRYLTEEPPGWMEFVTYTIAAM